MIKLKILLILLMEAIFHIHYSFQVRIRSMAGQTVEPTTTELCFQTANQTFSYENLKSDP